MNTVLMYRNLEKKLIRMKILSVKNKKREKFKESIITSNDFRNRNQK